MNWSRRIDGYCERVGTEFWAEPVNAWTNLAFLIAGIACIVMARADRRRDWTIYYLSGLICVISLGSFLFHTFATAWAALADTGPILLFILTFFTIAMSRFLGFNWWRAGLLTFGFLGALLTAATMTRGMGLGVFMPGEAQETAALAFWIAFAICFGAILGAGGTLVTALTISVGFPVAAFVTGHGISLVTGPGITGWQSYFPAMLALIGVGLYLRHLGHEAWVWLIAAGGVFAVSLTFRTLDQPICTVLPLGTHFLWHILNAVVLGTLVVGLIREGEEPLENNGRR